MIHAVPQKFVSKDVNRSQLNGVSLLIQEFRIGHIHGRDFIFFPDIGAEHQRLSAVQFKIKAGYITHPAMENTIMSLHSRIYIPVDVKDGEGITLFENDIPFIRKRDGIDILQIIVFEIIIHQPNPL
jgi:hypothetical protein